VTNGLDLGSPRWSELQHAYGSGVNIPALLRKAAAGDDDAVADLFGSILHQNSVYSASYAAVPHLVTGALGPIAVGIRADLLILVGGIHGWSDEEILGALAEDLRQWYVTAVGEAVEPAIALLPLVNDETQAIHLLEALAAVGGRPAAGRIVAGFADKEFAPSCPGCGCDLYVWPHEGGLSAAAEDPVSRPGTRRVAVREGLPPNSTVHGELEWVKAIAGTSSLLQPVAALLPLLYGIARCPACDREFGLMDRLWEEQNEHAA
jgi:hypothetical protein